MSIRSLLGLCQHKWRPASSDDKAIKVIDSRGLIVGYDLVRECAHCGAIKSFRV